MLILHRIGPGVSLQDAGRPGYLAQGVSRGGAADPRALAEAAALLGHGGAALEMAGFGGEFELTRPGRIALTGAPMQVDLDGRALSWYASHAVAPGQRLRIGGALSGVYGYLSIGGGFDVPPVMTSQARHHAAAIGPVLQDGDELPLGRDPGGDSGLHIKVEERFLGGVLRVADTAQTPLFSADIRTAFFEGAFTRGRRGNRQGVEIDVGSARFPVDGGQTILSEVITPGDIQMTGDGVPFVLLAECQTIGGYPRIGTVIPPDLPKIAQAAPGTAVQFQSVTLAQAVEAIRRDREDLAQLHRRVSPLLRDVATVNLLEMNLISGVSSGQP